MDGGLLIQTPCGVAALVDTLVVSVHLQLAVGYIRPCRPPYNKLFFAVPAFGEGILPAVAGAFGMLVRSDKSLRLGSRWRHIHLLFADLVGVLFLPTLVLCRPELSSGKAAFLAVSHAEVFLLGFVLPLALLIQRAHRQENVGMRIATVSVVDGSIGAHPFRHELLVDKILQQLDLLFPV